MSDSDTDGSEALGHLSAVIKQNFANATKLDVGYLNESHDPERPEWTGTAFPDDASPNPEFTSTMLANTLSMVMADPGASQILINALIAKTVQSYQFAARFLMKNPSDIETYHTYLASTRLAFTQVLGLLYKSAGRSGAEGIDLLAACYVHALTSLKRSVDADISELGRCSYELTEMITYMSGLNKASDTQIRAAENLIAHLKDVMRRLTIVMGVPPEPGSEIGPMDDDGLVCWDDPENNDDVTQNVQTKRLGLLIDRIAQAEVDNPDEPPEEQVQTLVGKLARMRFHYKDFLRPMARLAMAPLPSRTLEVDDPKAWHDALQSFDASG